MRPYREEWGTDMTRAQGFRPADTLRPRIRIAAYCNGCGTQIPRGFAFCPPCEKGQRIGAAVQAMTRAYEEARNCSRCAAALCTTGPEMYRLCRDCAAQS